MQESDKGRCWLIPLPQIRVDQYAASLGRWFGLSDGELIDALPDLRTFDLNASSGMLSWAAFTWPALIYSALIWPARGLKPYLDNS